MSESSSSHLGHVLSRWISIAEHLGMRKSEYPEALAPFMSANNDTGFAARYRRQIMPVHVATYYLLPESRLLETSISQKTLTVSFKVSFDNMPPPKPNTKPFHMNSKALELKCLPSSTAVVVGP